VISGILTFRDCITNGYPFIEAILSVLPFVDEYLINDGGSVDGTKEHLEHLAEVFPDKIKLYNILDYASSRWDCVSEQYNTLIDESAGDWIFQGDADEIIHEKEAGKLKYTRFTRANVLRFPRREVKWSWEQVSEKPYWPARAARKIEGLHQHWPTHGGDEFLRYEDGKRYWIRSPPECKKVLGMMIWHLYVIFPGNMLNKRKNDAEYVAREDSARVEVYERIRFRAKMRTNVTDSSLDLPALIRGMVGWQEYRVREELFDKEWLRRLTGLYY